jgi:hypothetical protein
MKKGPARNMTHDLCATTLFTPLNVLDGMVIGQCMAGYRHQEFIRFLNRIWAVVPVGKFVRYDAVPNVGCSTFAAALRRISG